MHAKRAAAALGQHIEVATRLRRLHDTKCRSVSRNRQIVRILARDLQKHASVWSALVGLAGRMEKARAKADAGCHMTPVADGKAHLLQHVRVRPVARHVGEEGGVVAGPRAAEMRFEPAFETAVAAGRAQRFRIARIGVEIEIVLS
jgi:hypothetical protein